MSSLTHIPAFSLHCLICLLTPVNTSRGVKLQALIKGSLAMPQALLLDYPQDCLNQHYASYSIWGML